MKTPASQSEGAPALLQRLHESGLLDHYSLLGDGNVRAWDWERMAGQMPAPEQALWRFLLLGAKLSQAAATELLGPAALGFLRRHKLCRGGKGGLSLGALSLISYRGRSFFVERSPVSRSHFGEDTKALMSLLPGDPKGACLALNPGCGAAVLPFVGGPEVQVTFWGGDYHPRVLAANLELSAAHGNCQFLEASQKIGAGHFDLILGSLPSFFEPAGIELPAFAAGGKDGLKRVKAALGLAERHLSPRGELLLTLFVFASADVKAMQEYLTGVLQPSALDYSLVVSSKLLLEPGSPVFNQMVSLATVGNPAGAPAAVDKILRHVRRMQYGAVYLLKGRFWQARDSRRRQIINYSDLYYGSWTF